MIYKTEDGSYCKHGSGTSGCVPCAIEGAYKALHEDNLKIIELLNRQSAQPSVQRIGLRARISKWFKLARIFGQKGRV
jgi:hypothetical protein